MLNEQDMARLIERAAEGDSAAFSTLYQEHLDPIYRFVQYRVNNKEDAEDLTQTVFMKAWKSLPNMREGSVVFSSWLYTIARNTVIDYWKKKRNVRIEDEETFFSSIPDARPIASAQVEIADDVQLLKRAMSALSTEQRALVTLRFLEDRTTEEIAATMKKNPAAIRAMQYRAIKALKEEMQKYES